MSKELFYIFMDGFPILLVIAWGIGMFCMIRIMEGSNEKP